MKTIAFTAALLLAGAAEADTFNGGFETPSGLGTTSYSGPGYGGESAAQGWYVNNNTLAETTTALEASTDPFGGGKMLHVTSAGGTNGVYQVMGGFTYASVDVKVLSGTFYIGAYTCSGSCRVSFARLSGASDWQRVSLEALSGADEIAIYSDYGQPGDFLIDQMYTGTVPAPVPEPGEWAMMLGGLAIAGAAARRRA